jgi:predicted NBD/HSP70 family sugar kinase
LVTLVNIFNPEYLVIGGPVAKLLDKLPDVKEKLDKILGKHVPGNGEKGFFLDGKDNVDRKKERFYPSTENIDIDKAEAMGAAILPYHSLFQVPDLALLEYELHRHKKQ